MAEQPKPVEAAKEGQDPLNLLIEDDEFEDFPVEGASAASCVLRGCPVVLRWGDMLGSCTAGAAGACRRPAPPLRGGAEKTRRACLRAASAAAALWLRAARWHARRG